MLPFLSGASGWFCPFFQDSTLPSIRGSNCVYSLTIDSGFGAGPFHILFDDWRGYVPPDQNGDHRESRSESNYADAVCCTRRRIHRPMTALGLCYQKVLTDTRVGTSSFEKAIQNTARKRVPHRIEPGEQHRRAGEDPSHVSSARAMQDA